MHRMADNIIAQVINLDGSSCVEPSAHRLALSPRFLRDSPRAAVPTQSMAGADKSCSTAGPTPHAAPSLKAWPPHSRLATEQTL